MIELTEQQSRALEDPKSTPLRLVDPRTSEAFVLLRAEEYDRLKEGKADGYDDSPWTREGLHAAAWEAGKAAGWDDMDEYDDDVPEKLAAGGVGYC